MKVSKFCDRCGGKLEKRPTGDGVRWVHVERDQSRMCRLMRQHDQPSLTFSVTSTASVVRK